MCREPHFLSNTPTQAGLTGVLVQRNKLRVFFGLAGIKPTTGRRCYGCCFLVLLFSMSTALMVLVQFIITKTGLS